MKRLGHKTLVTHVVMGMIALAAAALCNEPASASAGIETQRYGDVEAWADEAPTHALLYHGYAEIRVHIINRSAAKTHDVRIVFPADSSRSRYGQQIQRVSRSVQVAPGATMSVAMYLPPMRSYDNGIAVEVDGHRGEERLNFTSPMEGREVYYYSSARQVPIMVSRSVPESFREQMASANLAPFRNELATTQWSDNWLAYSCYSGVIMTEKDAAELPDAARLALRRYVECGGVLVIQGASAPTEFTDPAGTSGTAVSRLGLGSVRLTGLRNDEKGWGALLPQLGTIPFGAFDISSVPENNPLVLGNPKVPVHGIFLAILIFAVCIGPVNIMLLGRFNKRMLLWWNVPAVSLATCLVIFLYATFSEGWSGRARFSSLTLLDETAHRATTVGYMSFYSPTTPRDGLQLSDQTEITPLWEDQSRYGRPDNVSCTMDWTNGQHLDSGWIAARSPAYFSFRKNEDRRERLGLRIDNGRIMAANQFGVPIRRLYYCDDKWQVHEASDIAPGTEARLSQTVTLRPRPTDDATPARMQGLRPADWLRTIADLRDGKTDYLSPGCYIAICGRSPFVENALAGSLDDGSVGIVFGVNRSLGDGR
jgi:hypothetical protein